jgi:hypothetical protein
MEEMIVIDMDPMTNIDESENKDVNTAGSGEEEEINEAHGSPRRR